jgi:lipopolysaccharide export system permease protein
VSLEDSVETAARDNRATPPSHVRPSRTGGRFTLPLLDRYLLGEIVPQVLLYLLIVAGMFVLFTTTVVLRYLTNGVPFWIVMEVLGLNLPPYIVIAFPMSVLLGTILAFTKISSESEAVAILAAGVSFRRMLRSAAIVGAVLAVIGLVINNTVVPFSNKRLADLKEHALKENITSTNPFALPPVRTKVDGKESLQAFVWVEGGYDSTAHAMKDVYIARIDPATKRPSALIYGRLARWEGGQAWEMQDVDLVGAGMTWHQESFRTKEISLTPDAVAFLQRAPDSLTFGELHQQITVLKASGSGASDTIRAAEMSLWNKICLPLASFVFPFVGAALGFRPQRSASRGMAIGQGVMIIFLYYSLFKGMEMAGAGGQIEPFVAALIPVIAAALAAWGLTSRATT